MIEATAVTSAAGGGVAFSGNEMYTATFRVPTTRDPPADGGYPHDTQLHQMSDDGGPVGPDPARWTDPVWQDSQVARERLQPASVQPISRPHIRLTSGRPPVPEETSVLDLPQPGSLRWQMRNGGQETRARWSDALTHTVVA